MKFLNFIDLAVQTFIMGAVVLVSLAIAFTGSVESIALVALYGAIFLGPWQMVSSLITTVARGLYFKWRVIHLVSSIAYILVFLLGAWYANGSDALIFKIGGILSFMIPLVLAVFYYYITLKSFQLSRSTPKPA